MKTNERLMAIIGSVGWGITAGAMAIVGRYTEATVFALLCIAFAVIAIKSRKPS